MEGQLDQLANAKSWRRSVNMNTAVGGWGVLTAATLNVVPGSQHMASARCLLEAQGSRHHLRSTKADSALQQDPQVIHISMKFWESLF